MTNIREQMLAKTAGVQSTADRVPDPSRRSTRTETAPGMAGALAAAQLRVQELEATGTPSRLPVASLVPNPWQPRRIFNEAKLAELAESIREAGLVQPVVVRRAVSESGYQIVAGERRWRAHKILGLEDIKVVVIQSTDEDMAMLALVENVSRDDLSDYEISISIRQTEKEFPNRKRMAEMLGMSRQGLYRFLAYDSLPDFIISELDLRPNLIGGNAAIEVARVLSKHGESGIRAARELWPQVLSGDLPQYKYHTAISALVIRSATSDPNGSARSIEKFFSGKAQAGNITKDASSFVVKIKSDMLTEEKEREIREVIGRLFSTQPGTH